MSQRPARRVQQERTPEQKEQQKEAIKKSAEGIKNLFGGVGGGTRYTPVMKSLEQIGIPLRTMDVMLGDETVNCLVVPLNDLITLEWRYMSQLDAPLEPVDQGVKDDQGSSKVRRPRNVQGGSAESDDGAEG